jgi:TRIAD3 protein (E3 ubiquitin-protein ligase RNF216)
MTTMTTYTFECECCFEDVDAWKEVECTGKVPHRLCADCVCKQMEVDVSNGKVEMHCMMGRACGGVYPSKTRERVLEDGSRRRAEREECRREVEAAGLEGFWRCPFCDFGAIFEPVEGDGEFWCRNEECLRTSCRRCGREGHGGADCDEVVAVEVPAGMVRCPKCRRVCVRESGCNFLQCSCLTFFCALCGEEASYSHFGLGAECALFGAGWSA